MLLDGLMTRQADVYHVRSPSVYTSVMDVMAGFAHSACQYARYGGHTMRTIAVAEWNEVVDKGNTCQNTM